MSIKDMNLKEIDIIFIVFSILMVMGSSNLLGSLLLFAFIPLALFFCTPIWIFYLVRWAIREAKR